MTDTVTSSHDHFDGEGSSSGVGLLQAPASGRESARDSDPQNKTRLAADSRQAVQRGSNGSRRAAAMQYDRRRGANGSAAGNTRSRGAERRTNHVAAVRVESKPSRPTLQTALATSTDFARRFEIFSRYGNFTMAYSTLQPGLTYFESHGGYLAYDRSLGVDFVLADPVAPAENHRAIIAEFLKSHPRTCFCQVSKPTAAILSDLGYYVNEIGADIELDLPNYDFSGPKKSKFRQAANKVEREGYRIEELTASEVDPAAIERLCTSWRATKTVKREARFLTRPFDFEAEPEVRKFYLVSGQGEIVAFVAFDPICEDGRVIGYSPAIKRRDPNAPTGAEEAICKFAIERFHCEGMAIVRLGLLPLYQVEKSEFRESHYLRKVFQLLFQHGDRWVYSFRGHADFKHRYRGETQKVYFATYTRWRNVQSLIGLMRVCRIFAFSARSPQDAFPKRDAGGQRLLANRSSWRDSLRPTEADQVPSSSFCSHRRAPFTD
jgi:Phosphatidylglycerol lysyltransferase, C-terminal